MIQRLFKQMVISQIISAMAVMLCLVIDSIMISRFLGTDAMAAYGFANPVLLIFAAFGSLLSSGIQVVCSRAMGTGDEDKINRCYSLSVIIAAAVSIFGVIVVLVFADPLCVALGAKKGTEAFRLTKDYLIGFVIGAPFFIAAQILVPFLQMAGQRVRLVVAVLGMMVFDIAFDLLNVFVFKKETFGMGIASTVSYVAGVGIGIIYFFSKKCIYKFRTKGLGKGLFKEIAQGGVPTMVNQVSLVLLVYVINRTMMRVGNEVAVAAYAIVSTIANIGYCIGNGISEVSLMLAGISYNEEDEHSLSEIVRNQTIFSIVINLFVTIFFLALADPVISLFAAKDAPERSAAIFGLRMFAICLVVSSMNAAFKKYYQSIGLIFFSESISVMQNLIFPALVVIIGGALFGTTGVWFFYMIGEVLSLIYIAVVVWKKSRAKFGSRESFVCLPKNFGAAPGQAMEMEIGSMEDIQEVAIEAEEFCKEKGVTAKKAMYTALCIEEMANNIVTHGFKAGKDNQIDIRLVCKQDELIIRIRDNCVGFDPVKYYQMTKPDMDDPTKHIGIRMVFKMTRDVKYVNSLGLNCLTMKI
ncbi:MAG: ATP-binding protein [Eubacterium sp.]|nr:ATP-binding protein [Eubacterium sp.]